jgi:hypothetical protein
MPGEIVAPVRFSIRQARLEGAVVDLIRRWATAFPHELVALDKMVKGIRRETDGVSDHGMYMAEIPVTLDEMLKAKISRTWSQRPEIRNLVLRNFRVGCINLSAVEVRGE